MDFSSEELYSDFRFELYTTNLQSAIHDANFKRILQMRYKLYIWMILIFCFSLNLYFNSIGQIDD